MSARNTYDFKSQGNQPKAQFFLNFKMANRKLFEKSAEHSYCYFLLSNFFAGKASVKTSKTWFYKLPAASFSQKIIF